MKFAWFPALCLLAIHTAEAFKDLFKPRPHDKPSILEILTKPKIPVLNFQLGSHLGSGSFGFGFGFGGQYLPPGTGVNLPPKETVNVKPDYPENPWEEKKKETFGPRPNWGEEKDHHPRPGSYDDGKDGYPKPGSYEDKDYTKPGAYDDYKPDYPNPGSLKENEDYPKPDEKDSLPDWDDIGEKNPKSESLMNSDLIGDGLIQPRLNRRRSKRFIESRVFHVPLQFRSNGKPYQVKIRSNPNSLTKGNAEV